MYREVGSSCVRIDIYTIQIVTNEVCRRGGNGVQLHPDIIELSILLFADISGHIMYIWPGSICGQINHCCVS